MITLILIVLGVVGILLVIKFVVPPEEPEEDFDERIDRFLDLEEFRQDQERQKLAAEIVHQMKQQQLIYKPGDTT